MEYISKKDLAQLKGKTIVIKKVFGPYRKGWNEGMKRFETFKNGSETMTVREGGSEVETDGKVDFKIHKKKYDIIIELNSPAEVICDKWNKDLGDNEEVSLEDTEFTVKEISATMLGDIMACGVAFGKVPTDDEGNREFDWEEKFIDAIQGTAVVFDTEKKDWSINGKSGKYDAFTFKEASATDIEEEDDIDDDLPFN